MNKIYIPQKNISKGLAALTDQGQMHHLRNVLRTKIGDKFIVFDGSRFQYDAAVTEINPDVIIFKLSEKMQPPRQEGVDIVIACAIPKRSKIEDIIDRLTQLGITRIIPLETERVIVKLNSDKKAARLQKWLKVALNASQQSQRDILPIIDPVSKFSHVISIADGFDLKLIPTLPGKRKTIKDALVNCPSKPRRILVLIGPEGDFTPDEIHTAEEAGFIPVSLGDTVLRVETAAIAVASFIKLYAND